MNLIILEFPDKEMELPSKVPLNLDSYSMIDPCELEFPTSKTIFKISYQIHKKLIRHGCQNSLTLMLSRFL